MSRLQRVATMPKQSLTAMKVAFGVRAQYATILTLVAVMVTQIIGVVVFSGNAHAYAANDFVTTWKTDNPGGNPNEIFIPTTGSGYNYTVDWGDGNVTSGHTSSALHAYAVAGTYTVKITGTFPRIYVNCNNSIRQKILSVEQWGTNQWSSMNGAFCYANNLQINATDTPDLSNVTNMNQMFYMASSMNANINNWDVSHVTIMETMFGHATSFNQPLNSWNVSNVTYMATMFESATSFNQPLDNWNTSSVISMYHMFDGATNFNQSLASWNMTSVTDTTMMLSSSGISTANYDATLTGWASQNLTSSLSFSAAPTAYCTAETARQSIITTFNWSIADGGKNCPVNPPEIITNTLNDGIIGSNYYGQIQTSSGFGPISYSIVSGDLPPGLSMGTDGYISGIIADETVPGSTYTFTVQLNALNGTATKELSIYVLPYEPLQLCYVPRFALPVPLGYTVPHDDFGSDCATGGFGLKTYSVIAGALPTGIQLDPLTGDIYGTFTEVGTYHFTVQVSDITGSISAEVTIVVVNVSDTGSDPVVSIISPVNNTQFDASHDSVTVMGTGPANQTIAAYMDNYPIGTTSTDQNGNWTYDVHNIFPGTHSFDAKWTAPADIAFIPSVSLQTADTDILMINTVDQSVLKTITLPPGAASVYSSPTLNHAGTKVYIPVFDAYAATINIYEYDLTNGAITHGEPIWPAPFFTSSLVISPDDTYGYISQADDGLTASYQKVDLSTLNPVGSPVDLTADSGHNVFAASHLGSAMAFHGDSLYTGVSVTSSIDPLTITTINLINNAITSIQIDDQPRCELCLSVIYGTKDRVYYIANNQLVVMNPDTNEIVKTIALSDVEEGVDAAFTLAVSSNDQTAYISIYAIWGGPLHDGSDYNPRLLAIDIASGTVQDVTPPSIGVTLQDVITGIALANNDTRLYLSDYGLKKITANTAGQGAQIVSSGIFGPVGSDGGAVYHTGPYYVGPVQPITASTTFSVGLGPIVIDAIKICNGNQRESIPVKQPYSRQACTTGGSGPKTFTLGLDPLPEGLSLDSDTGEITGTPTVPGTYGFSVTVTDSTGSDIGEYTIVVLPEEDPIITDVTPASTPAPPKTNPVKAPKTVVSTQNNIFALAKRIPEPFAIGFPWFLLALALVLVGIQYYQVHSEAASTKRMQASVANQERLVDEQNNFVALSTHYLHTPLTVMEGEISLMVKAGTLTQDQANKLKSTLTSLNAEAEAVLAQEEQSE